MKNPPSYARVARMSGPELIQQLKLPQKQGLHTLIWAEIELRLEGMPRKD